MEVFLFNLTYCKTKLSSIKQGISMLGNVCFIFQDCGIMNNHINKNIILCYFMKKATVSWRCLFGTDRECVQLGPSDVHSCLSSGLRVLSSSDTAELVMEGLDTEAPRAGPPVVFTICPQPENNKTRVNAHSLRKQAGYSMSNRSKRVKRMFCVRKLTIKAQWHKSRTKTRTHTHMKRRDTVPDVWRSGFAIQPRQFTQIKHTRSTLWLFGLIHACRTNEAPTRNVLSNINGDTPENTKPLLT